MTITLPKTLVPNTPENVSDAQANFDALATALNNVLGDVTGTIDNLAVDKITKQQTRVGLGGTVESTSVTSVVLRSNFDPASGHLIDQNSPSWRMDIGGSDEIIISRAAATSGIPSYGTVLTIDSSGISGITTTVGDGSITSAKIADGTIVNADVNTSAGIAQSKIANLTTDLAAKAPTNHTHSISQVTNLQSSLDGKAVTTGDTFTGVVTVTRTNGTDNSLTVRKTADSQARLLINAQGDVKFGTGSAGQDASITYSSGDLVLNARSGKDVHVAGKLSGGGAAEFDGTVQLNNGLNVDGAGTTLDGGTFEVQPLQGGGFGDSDPARFKVTATGVSFHGNTPITRRTINGARDDNTASGALENLLNFLDDLGLIHDNTTAS